MTGHDCRRHFISRIAIRAAQCAVFFCVLAAVGQNSGEMANRLRQNTVRIHATSSGFGFITGERNGYLYVVTARHLFVPGDQPDVQVPSTVKVSFYSEQGKSFDAEVLGTHKGDMAVLRVQKPPGFEWIRSCLAESSKQVRGTSVWYVGRKGDWFVPFRPGAIASPPSSSFDIQVDDLRVTPGTSGAPLVADTGIVGMILNDSEDITTAVSVDFIERAFREWNHPWDLAVAQNSAGSGTTSTTGAEKTPISVDDSLDGTIYTNRTANFQVTVPSGWILAPELRSQQPDIIAALQSADRSLFLFVTPETYSGSLDTYKLLAETTFRMKFKDYERLSESPVQLDGRKGLRMVFHGKNASAGDVQLKFLVYIVPLEGKMMRLSFGTLEPLFDDAETTFEKMAASYHILGGAPSTAVAEKPGTAARVVEESLEGTSYVNKTAGFRLSVPENWQLAPELRKDNADVVAALKSPDEIFILLVTPEAYSGTLNTYKKLTEVGYKTNFKDYEEISESAAELDGRKGLRMIWHAKTGSENTLVKALVYFIPYESSVLRLSFLTTELLFDDGAPTFEKIAASYHHVASSKPGQ